MNVVSTTTWKEKRKEDNWLEHAKTLCEFHEANL